MKLLLIELLLFINFRRVEVETRKNMKCRQMQSNRYIEYVVIYISWPEKSGHEGGIKVNVAFNGRSRARSGSAILLVPWNEFSFSHVPFLLESTPQKYKASK